nr:PqiC family protein [Chromobacterium sp. ASV5]
MMRHGLIMLGLAAALAGCASPSPRLHTLDALSAAPAAAPVWGKRLMVGPVNLPAGLDRAQLVTLGERGELQWRDLDRWAGPLDRMLAQALAAQLTRRAGLASVYVYPQSGMDGGDYKLLLDVRGLSLQPGREAALVAAWQLLRTRDGQRVAQGYFQRRKACAAGVEASVAAARALLDELGEEVAATLLAQAEWSSISKP